MKHFPGSFASTPGCDDPPLQIQLLMCQVGGRADLLEVAAKGAFWQLSRTACAALCAHLHFDHEDGDSRFDVLWKLIQGATGLGDEAVLEIISQRAVRSQGCTNVEELLRVDDAVEVMDKEDQKNASGLKATAQEIERVRREFSDCVRSRRQAIAAQASQQAASSSSSRARRGTAAPRPLRPYTAVPPGDLTQPQLAARCPPKGHVWKGRRGGTWQGHLPPHSRVSYSWSAYGGREAGLLVLKDLWGAYMEDTGLQECPVAGLLQEVARIARKSST